SWDGAQPAARHLGQRWAKPHGLFRPDAAVTSAHPNNGHTMKRSTDRILTTHVGSLIRPPRLQELLRARQKADGFDQASYDQCLTQSVADVVQAQADTGIDVVSDGEFGKSISWSQYVLDRLSGFERRPFKPGGNVFQRGADRTRFAEFYAELDA